MKDELQAIWFREIKERLNLQCIMSSVLYGGDTTLIKEDYLIRERRVEQNVKKALKRLKCDDEEVLKLFEEYGDAIRKAYYEMGVRIGICLEAELLGRE